MKSENHPKTVFFFTNSHHFSSAAGYDPQEVLVKVLSDAADAGAGQGGGAPPEAAVGVDCATGEPVAPKDIGVLDNYKVKKQVRGETPDFFKCGKCAVGAPFYACELTKLNVFDQIFFLCADFKF